MSACAGTGLVHLEQECGEGQSVLGTSTMEDHDHEEMKDEKLLLCIVVYKTKHQMTTVL